jgi:hypothetical protein
MARVRQSLTFENVLVTVLAFAVLAGGTAIAAGQLGKNSVGKKQLKKNAVTTAKIRKAAVTAAKIRDGAIDGAKVRDGSIADADINVAELPFGKVVHRVRGGSPVLLPAPPNPITIPLDNPSYTQEAGRSDSYVGAVDLTFSDKCEPPRFVIGFITLDTPPAEIFENEFLSAGQHIDTASAGAGVARLNIGAARSSFRPAVATNHTIYLTVYGACGGAGTVTLSDPAVDVIGVR